MTNVQTKLTYADYMKTPDDEYCELLHGELVMFTTPPIYHQEVLGSLLAKLAAFEREYHPGQFYPVLTDVVLSDRDVVQPDLLFVSTERAAIITADNARARPTWWSRSSLPPQPSAIGRSSSTCTLSTE